LYSQLVYTDVRSVGGFFTMMHWLIANSSWIFSGIGVLVVSVVGKLIWDKMRARDQGSTAVVVGAGASLLGSPVATGSHIIQNVQVSFTETKAEEEPASEYKERPSAKEIFDDLRRLAPYQRLVANDSYRGVKVRWRGRFAGLQIEEQDQSKYRVLIRDDSGRPNAAFRISIEANPRVKLAKEGDRIQVFGTIHDVLGVWIWLEDATVEVL
jgi:hypothetical protein